MSKNTRIGEASLGEDGLVSGGKPGDQTGREVRIVEDYDITEKEYDVLLRPATTAVAEASAQACEQGCANENIGYSQTGRLTLYEAAEKVGFNLSKEKLTTKCNTDCSAFMAVCALAGGATVSYNATTNSMATSNAFTKNDDYIKYVKKEHPKYFESVDYLKRGDILVKANNHTIMVLDNGSKASSDTTVFSSGLQTIDYSTYKLNINIKNISSTSASVVVGITHVTNNNEKSVSEKFFSDFGKLTYTLKSFDGTYSYTLKKPYDIVANPTTIKLPTDLAPNTAYIIKVSTSENKIALSSPKVIFTTLKLVPSSISKLSVAFTNDNSLDRECYIQFNNNTSINSGYIVRIFANGKQIASKDYENGDVSSVNRIIKLSDIYNDIKNVLSYNDVLQIGVQPWRKDEKGNKLFEVSQLKCSDPVYLKYLSDYIKTIYIQIDNKFKPVILYHK